jgi:hypothetical protein
MILIDNVSVMVLHGHHLGVGIAQGKGLVIHVSDDLPVCVRHFCGILIGLIGKLQTYFELS